MMSEILDALLKLEKQMACVLDFYRNMAAGDLDSSIKARMELTEMNKHINSIKSMFLKEQTRLSEIKKNKRKYKKVVKDIQLGYIKI